MVPEVQASDIRIQEMLPVACDENAMVKSKTSTTKS